MASSSASSLRALLEEPFGPYWETMALSGLVKNTTVKNPVALRGLVLESGGVITGLTECEPSMPEYNQQRFDKHPARFMGTLEIQCLSWLMPDVFADIEAELRERDTQARRSPNNLRPQRSNLTLRMLYAPSPGFVNGRYKVKVTIQAWISGSASYLLSEAVPEGLRIGSNERNYAVETMSIFSYELSRLYLSRWRLYNCLERLVQISSFTDALIPYTDRTPDWYIDVYSKHYAYHSGGRQIRAVHAESDSDIEAGTNGRMKGRREHPLRHVPRAEMESWIAQHAEWLIQQTRGRRRSPKRLFDPDRWQKNWLPDVRRTRESAATAGRRWGSWEGTEVPVANLDDIPLPPTPLKRKRGVVKKKSPTVRGVVSLPASLNATTSSAPPHDGGGYDDDAMRFYDTTTDRVYDPDFSPLSTDNEAPSTSDEDDDIDADSELIPLTDPEIIALIPSSFRRLPAPPVSLKWKCTECDYIIDLLNLTEGDLDNPEISYVDRQRLRSKRWSMFREKDKWAYQAFLHMVDKHHADHLDEWGITFRRAPGRWVALWKDGRRPESSLLRQIRVDDRRRVATVKSEEL